MHGGLGFLGLTGGDARYDTDQADALVLEVSTSILRCGEYSVLDESPRFRYLLYLPCFAASVFRLAMEAVVTILSGDLVGLRGYVVGLLGCQSYGGSESRGEPAFYAANMIVRLTLLIILSLSRRSTTEVQKRLLQMGVLFFSLHICLPAWVARRHLSALINQLGFRKLGLKTQCRKEAISCWQRMSST